MLADMTTRTSGSLAVNFLTEQVDRDAGAAAGSGSWTSSGPIRTRP
jgi:hypothetical protein